MTRNYGAERGHGEYLIILDSDCILPEGYLAAVESELQRQKADAFGGPDCAHDSFTNIQKAINYAMTSFFTTGGIRGGKKKMDKFYPRSFNMGVRAEVYKALGGFSKMRFGEDIDFSIRIFQGGYVVFLLWGRNAQSKEKLITNPQHLILKCAHPSPFSAYNGFFGCNHFKMTNAFLKEHGLKEIDWQIEN